MTASAEFTEYILAFLAPVLPVRVAKFFGGAGIYCDNVQFAMIMHNTLYFAVDDISRPKYSQLGMQAFSYQTQKGQVLVRKYFELPETVLDDPEQLQIWANEALQVAYHSRKPKRNPR